MAKSIILVLGFQLIISFCCYEVLSINAEIWHKAWKKFCVEKSGGEEQLKHLKKCDIKLTKEVIF